MSEENDNVVHATYPAPGQYDFLNPKFPPDPPRTLYDYEKAMAKEDFTEAFNQLCWLCGLRPREQAVELRGKVQSALSYGDRTEAIRLLTNRFMYWDKGR